VPSAARESEKEERVEQEANYRIGRHRRRPWFAKTEADSPAACGEDNPAGKDKEGIRVPSGGPERESSGNTARDEEAPKGKSGHIPIG